VTNSGLIRAAGPAFLLLAAFLAGFLTAPERAAASSLTVARVNPGTAAITTATITCSDPWHGTGSPCGTAGDQMALDWANADGSGVHFRTWAFRGAGTGIAYYATKSVNNSACRRVRVRLESPSGTIRGDAFYTHTKIFGTDGYTYSITGSTSYYFTSHTVGTTVRPYDANDAGNSDLYGCQSSAAHLHQGASTTAARNTLTYNSSGNYYSIADNSKWQHEWSWYQ
jgi:hypothetical protein